VKVFISSLIAGYAHHRTAAQQGAETLSHHVVRAEGLPASSGTPQQACLAGVRESDAVLLLMGARYGAVQPSGLSATHEEYREARERTPVLVFVESGVERDAQQQAFLEEVQAWATGHFRASFSTAEELKEAVVRALHEHELATASGTVDESEMVARANALVPGRQGFGGSPSLVLAVVGAPYQQVLRPAEIGHDSLARDLQRDAGEGTKVAVRGNALALEQPTASVRIDQTGRVVVVQPARKTAARSSEISALIEEDVTVALARALRFSGWLLDRVDPPRRLTDVVVVVALRNAGYMPWRTKAEQAASPNAASMGGASEEAMVTLSPPRRHRQALTHDADHMAEDLAVLLRRQRQP
jgi:hypothetical protein